MSHKKTKKRILFVDDEPNILKGLQRMLRSMRHKWDMKFAGGGTEALEILSRETFDVVVSDMRMPGMDGVQFLTTVKKRYPMMVRIILSGHSDQEMILKSIHPAHQYIAKPCNSEKLISTLTRTCTLQNFLDHPDLRQIIAKTDSLPSLPPLYTDILNELRSPEASLKRVGNIIEKDLSMSAKILQMVNSSFFGIPRHISGIPQAVILLGIDTLRSLILTIGIFSKLEASTATTRQIKQVYKHSINTGIIAREIAIYENASKKTVDNAFITGLLHDLGKVLLAVNFPANYAEILRLSQEKKLSFIDVEFQIMGATHAQVGAYLLGLWGLPETIVKGVASHHTPDEDRNKVFNSLMAVHVANILEQNTHWSENKMVQAFNTPYMKEFEFYKKIPNWKKISDQVIFNGV